MADNLSLNSGTGPDKARTLDRGSNVHTQVAQIDIGGPAGESLLRQDNPMPVADNQSSNLLLRILQMLMAPLGYDKSLGRSRGTVLVESGTVTTVTTVTTCTTVSTLSNIAAVGGYSAQMGVFDQNRSAWAQCVRARIT